jgi:hypothetical protein
LFAETAPARAPWAAPESGSSRGTSAAATTTPLSPLPESSKDAPSDPDGFVEPSAAVDASLEASGFEAASTAGVVDPSIAVEESLDESPDPGFELASTPGVVEPSIALVSVGVADELLQPASTTRQAAYMPMPERVSMVARIARSVPPDLGKTGLRLHVD